MRARYVVSAAVAAALIATGVFVGRDTNRESSRPRSGPGSAITAPPTSAPELGGPPDPETSSLFTGDAALVATFRSLYKPLLVLQPSTPSDDQKAVCELVAANLASDVDPAKLVDAATAVQDATLSELTFNARVTVPAALSACVSGDSDGRNREISVLAGIDAMFDRRLNQIS